MTTWVDLDGIMQSEARQMVKDKYCMIPPVCGIQKSQSHRNRMVVARGWERGKGEDIGQRVQTSLVR